jgi:hypothetical protein
VGVEVGVGVEAVQAARRDDPVDAPARFENLFDAGRGAPVTDLIGDEARAVEVAQAVARAEPQKALGVTHEVVDETAAEAVGRSVDSDGQAFGARGGGREQTE